LSVKPVEGERSGPIVTDDQIGGIHHGRDDVVCDLWCSVLAMTESSVVPAGPCTRSYQKPDFVSELRDSITLTLRGSSQDIKSKGCACEISCASKEYSTHE